MEKNKKNGTGNRELKDASSWSAWIKPPAAAAAAAQRPNQHVLTYESQGECVYKTCVVCLVWLLSCLCSWPHTDQTNAGCTSLKHLSRELGEGVGTVEVGSRWSWPWGHVIVSSEETVFTVFSALEWACCIMTPQLPNLLLFCCKFSGNTLS